MRAFKRLGAGVLALTIGAAPAAHAATLWTPPASPDLADDAVIFCQIRNVGPGPMNVTMEGFTITGALFPSSKSATLSPGESASHLINSQQISSCRFTVSGSPRNARGVALYWNGDDYTLALPAR